MKRAWTHSGGHTATNWKSPTYRCWDNMRRRCMSPHYRKRRITVCERWQSFTNFLADMGVKPGGKREYTLERIDNDGDYEPDNCRWATRIEQGNNMSTNIRYSYRGKAYTIPELARATGVTILMLKSRLVGGKGGPWTVESAVETPSQKGSRSDLLGPMAGS